MAKSLTLFHGSTQVVTKPTYGVGSPYNDYGLGFYCTESLELAKEWSASEDRKGVVNEYRLSLEGLSILNLNNGEYSILNWLAVLLQNRVFNVSGNYAPAAKQFIDERFGIDYSSYDVIRGYRADDSYFSFAQAFLNNALSLPRLERAMALGNLGEQVVIRSPKAFEHLEFKGTHEVDNQLYYQKRIARDTEARAIYREEIRVEDIRNEPSIATVIEQDWSADDARLRRIVFK